MANAFPLSKTIHLPDDYDWLSNELEVVDQHFTKAAEQHPMRRWEYAMALRAFDQWGGRGSSRCVDVGGAGSPFWHMLPADNVDGVDPKEGYDLAAYLALRPRLADAVFCLSVLEHVDDLDRFLYHLGCLVAPGGLLFLTMDAQESDGPDRAHFHWDRKRIFGRQDWRSLADTFTGTETYAHGGRDFTLLGEADWSWHGAHLYGSYSFASLALIKRP